MSYKCRLIILQYEDGTEEYITVPYEAKAIEIKFTFAREKEVRA